LRRVESGALPDAFDAQIVLHVRHARDGLRDVIRPPLLEAPRHRAGERHLAVRDADLDVAGVDAVIVGEAVVHVLADAVVGARVVARPSTDVVLRGFRPAP
jgi:hypothetical protein